MSVQILTGDCRDVLCTLPDESVHCCVSSPPYWNLRDYGTEGQIGLEPDFTDYITTMVEVFREVRRVLRKDGICWINMGDTYASAWPCNRRNEIGLGSLANGKQEARPSRLAGLKEKDLCGIPWRVAFALQAPDYLGRIRKETDRAWLAALVDGEGCISILETTSPHGSGASYPPILQVRMCDPEMIARAMELVGSNGDNPAQYPPSMDGQRPAFQWRIHARKAADTIAEIYPFLLIKRKQAIIAWNAQAAREGYEVKRGTRIPADAVEKQKLCRELIQKLNQRQSVDLPSWMIEPPQPIGPGWYLRSDVIWSKPNPMPESVTDRPTKAHEYLFLLTKAATYYYDAEAIREEAEYGYREHTGEMRSVAQDGRRHTTGTTKGGNPSAGRNKRSVWHIATAPFSEAHFATFPPALIEPCIKAGTSEKGCCTKCGAPWVREIERGELVPTRQAHDKRAYGIVIDNPDNNDQGRNRAADGHRANMAYENKTIGWSPSCSCATGIQLASGETDTVSYPAIPCTVLDPFGGAGTTGLVADRLQRNAILIELNPEYAAMARRRIDGDAPLFSALALPSNRLEAAE